MKGFIIFEDFKKLINCKEILDGDYNCVISDYPNGTFSGIINRVTGATCSKDDTYDFETGALIALMKMCGVEKVVRACNEAFSEDTFKTYATKFENELNTLKKDFYKKNYEDVKEHYRKLGDRNKYLVGDINKKLEYIKEKDEEIDKLKKEKEQIIVARSILNNKLIEENSNLSYIKSCNESTIESLEKTRDLLINKNNELIEENKRLKAEKVLSWKNYQRKIQKKQDRINELERAYKASNDDEANSIEEWLYKPPTKREEMWDKIFELHKESDVIIEVKKEDVSTFLYEIEDKIPEITWVSGNKIFEAKGTIKDIYEELMTHNRIYFRLSKKNKLSYSSDLNTYLFKNLDMIAYLPPMRWDLFKKGRLAVKVNYDNYKEFYEACKKELGKKPSTMYTGVFTISICKKDGFFEIFTIEDQKKTGRKIVDWEDVR